VGSVAMLQAVAGPDGVVNSTELPAVNISYLSTSLAVLAEEESSAPINSDAGFAEASAAVDSSSLIRVAASLKTALDVDIAIGLETDTTLTILANTPLRKDVTEALETEFPDQLTNATAEIAADSRRPYVMADVPANIYITAHGNLAFGGLAANLQFNPDGSGTYQGFNGATETSWTVNQVGHIVVTFLTPFVSEAFFDVDGNGTQDRQVTTFDRTTLQRFETGNVADHVFVLDHRILTYPEDPSIPTEELNGDTGPETARLAVSQVIPFTAGDLSGQALTASFYHQENNAVPNSPPEFGFDTLDFNSDGTGSSRRRQLAFSWGIDTTGVLSVVFASGDENDFIGLLPEDDGVLNAILTATQASGDAFTSRSFVVSRDETLGFNASNLENIRYRSVATTDRTLNQSGLSVFDFEFSPGGDACRVPGSGASEWSWLSANNRVEISRTSIFDGSLVSYRTWQPLRLIENRYWVIETLEFSDVPTDANTTPGRAAIYSMQQSLEGNTRPVANDDNVFGDTNEPTYVLLTSLVANDIDADGDEIILAANDSTSANGGTVTQLTSPGGRVAGLKYIPPPGFVGTDTFTYGITDLF
ncbi:MAG: Ig-like domain-containing protein, partial [Gammaproteobacteria bacterium]|nr:Ig-like domain-containing protein [Gammaproteobacteria bacterium]